MKTPMLPLLAALALTFSTVSAQTAVARPARETKDRKEHTPGEHAAKKTEKMTKELGLNADQAAKVKQILTARDQEMQAARAKAQPGAAREQTGEQMQASRAKYDAQFKEVLTAEQYTKYTQLRAEHDKKHHGHGPHDGAAGTQKSKVKTK